METKVTPEVLQTINLIEISEKLSAILDKLDRQRARGNIYPTSVNVSTTATRIVILFSAVLINDGAGDVYILHTDRVITPSDAALGSGETLTLDMKEWGQYEYYLKTSTGTATVRIFGLE